VIEVSAPGSRLVQRKKVEVLEAEKKQLQEELVNLPEQFKAASNPIGKIVSKKFWK
jgi:hypothetical protein